MSLNHLKAGVYHCQMGWQRRLWTLRPTCLECTSVLSHGGVMRIENTEITRSGQAMSSWLDIIRSCCGSCWGMARLWNHNSCHVSYHWTIHVSLSIIGAIRQLIAPPSNWICLCSFEPMCQWTQWTFDARPPTSAAIPPIGTSCHLIELWML